MIQKLAHCPCFRAAVFPPPRIEEFPVHCKLPLMMLSKIWIAAELFVSCTEPPILLPEQDAEVEPNRTAVPLLISSKLPLIVAPQT